jgi:hypothetical protein
MTSHLHPEEGPLSPITTPLPPGSFENVRDDIEREFTILSAESTAAGRPRLSVGQEFVLQQVASRGILGILQRMKVRGAAELADQLDIKIADDSWTNLVSIAQDQRGKLFNLTSQLDALRAEDDDQAQEETDAEAEERWGQERKLAGQIPSRQRLVSLADAVNATANAAVSAFTNPEDEKRSEISLSTIERARKEIEDAAAPTLVEGRDSSIGSMPSHALFEMLAKIEGDHLPEGIRSADS